MSEVIQPGITVIVTGNPVARRRDSAILLEIRLPRI